MSSGGLPIAAPASSLGGLSKKPVSQSRFDLEFGQCHLSYVNDIARALCTLCCYVCSRCEACVEATQKCAAHCALKSFLLKRVISTVSSRSPRIPGIRPRESATYSSIQFWTFGRYQSQLVDSWGVQLVSCFRETHQERWGHGYPSWLAGHISHPAAAFSAEAPGRKGRTSFAGTQTSSA